MIKTISRFFNELMGKYTPDPFILALFLTGIIVVLSLFLTPHSLNSVLLSWGDSFWGLMPFTMQMVMVFVGGYALASTPTINKYLKILAKKISCPHTAVLIVSLISCVGCLLNWGFGLVISSLLCREIIKVMPHANFRLMVAGAYGGFLLFHGGLSASIPLMIATKGNFSEPLIGGLIPISETLFSPLNIFLVSTLVVLVPLTLWYLSHAEKDHGRTYTIHEEEYVFEKRTYAPAEKLEHSRLFCIISGSIGVLYILIKIFTGTFSLELNYVCFFLLFLAILFQKNTKAFLNTIDEAAKRVGPIILQFPFYAGITGILKSTGLATMIAGFFAQISTAETFDLISFYVAGFLTLFVPSGGGLWVIEAPIVIETAKNLQSSLPKACMAVAWGDAWTHMIQPFWALPVLAIAGLKLRDIMGYCVILLIVSGIIITTGFILF